MSSLKSKTILVVAVVLLLGITTGLVTWQFTRNRSASDLQGFWEGTLDVRQNMALRLVLKVDKLPDGSYAATMDSIDQGAKDVPIGTVTLSNTTVSFLLASMQGRYEGTLNASATEMSGEWEQGRRNLPLTFKRTKNPSTIATPLSAAAYARRQDSPLQGAWKGTINAGGVPLRVVVKISEASPGKFAGTMDSTDQGARNIPLTVIEFSKPIARFDVSSIDGHYEGALKDDGSEIDGTWTQVGKDFPLLLQRADPAEEAAAAPSESAYAFASEKELQGVWRGALDAGGTTLRLVLKIARATNGTYTAAMDSLDQGARDISAASVIFNDPNVEVEWPALRALFHGNLEKGKLVGFWQQGASDLPIEFERSNRVASASAPKGKN